MATLRTVLNNVLTVLGEDEIGAGVSELTEDYHKLLLVFFNQIKEIVEDAHQWGGNTRYITFTAAASSIVASAVETDINGRMRMIYEHDDYRGQARAVIVDDTNATEVFLVKEIDLAEITRLQFLDQGNEGTPDRVAFAMIDTTSPKLYLYPVPNTARTYTALMCVPQNAFTATDLDTVINIPARPIEIGTIWYALQERGEELGVNGTFTRELFDQTLGEVIAQDANRQGMDELVSA